MHLKESAAVTSASPAKRISTRDLALAGMIAAILTIISQISIPMPTGVPITIQVFGILLGAVGLPIFANFRGGFSVLVDFTGGYIWSWPLMSVLCGLRFKTASRQMGAVLSYLFPLIGLAVNEAAGGLQWAFLAGDMSVGGVFVYSMTAFVPKDIVLTILAVVLGTQMRRLLIRAGFLTT